MSQLLPKLEFAVQSLFRGQTVCPHCKIGSTRELAKKYAKVSIRRCDRCSLDFTSPIYQSAIVSDFYDFFYGADGSTTKVPNAEELENLKENNFEGSDKYFFDRIARLKAVSEGQKKLLEIGSSWGYFLYQAQNQGFDVTGVELSDSRREFGKKNLGVDVVKSFDEIASGLFNIVYTAHTLEHFIDLSFIFSDINRALTKEGLLLIEVPNFDYDSFGDRALSQVGAIHPIGFSSQFFRKNLPGYGFEIMGFFDSWNDFPDNASYRSNDDVVLLLAKKKS